MGSRRSRAFFRPALAPWSDSGCAAGLVRLDTGMEEDRRLTAKRMVAPLLPPLLDALS